MPDYAERRSSARCPIDAGTESERGARDHAQMLARIQGAPNRSEIPTLLSIDLPCLSQTSRRLVSAAYSRNLHYSGALQAYQIAATERERASFARRPRLSRGGGSSNPRRAALRALGQQRMPLVLGPTGRLSAHTRLRSRACVCRGQASNPILALRGEGKNEDAKSRPDRDSSLSLLSNASFVSDCLPGGPAHVVRPVPRLRDGSLAQPASARLAVTFATSRKLGVPSLR